MNRKPDPKSPPKTKIGVPRISPGGQAASKFILKTILIFLIAVLILLACGTAALAQSGYLLTSSVIAGGGGSLQAGSYSLTGTTGQAEAGPPLQSGNYALQGGFWQPSDGYRVFVPHLTK